MPLLNNEELKITRGDKQRLPSWDETDYWTLRDDEGNPYDLTDRTVDLALVINRTKERIALTNSTEVHSDPTTGQVAITLEESDTSIPIEGRNEILYGEFRLEGGTEDPTTAGVFKLTVYPSRHNIEVGATLLPYADDFGSWAENGVMDAEGADIINVGETSTTTLTASSGTTTADLTATGVVELGGVRFWFSPTEPTEAAEDDVWVETTA